MSLLDELVAARRPWTSDVVRSWYDADTLDAHARSGLTVEADRWEDAAFGASLRDWVGSGASGDALDWANRILELGSGGWALTGIRYRGGDPARPFVEIVATTEPPTPAGMARVAEAALPAYAPFAPRSLRFDVADPDSTVRALETDDRFGPGSGVDQYVAAERLTVLRAYPRAPGFDRVTLRPSEPEPMAARAAEIYAEVGTSRPGQSQWATPEDLESLTGSAREGLLFEILVDGVGAGVLASLRYDAHALAGWSVQEIVVDAAHRGRHVAAAALQHLVDLPPAEPGATLWGTIHPGNRASLRNAQSVGRLIVGGYVWVTPAALPGMT